MSYPNHDAPRETLSLNGRWRCQPDAEGRGRRLGYHRVGFEFMDRIGSGYGSRMWREVNIPCCYSHCGPDMRRYEGMAWFRRSFAVPAAWRDQHVFVRFEALNFLARIWVNDRFVTTTYDGLCRLDIRLDPYLNFGAENTIIISTDNSERPDDRAPGKGLGYYLSGGIVADVTLVATAKTHIEGARFAFAEPRPANGGEFALNVTVTNTAAAAAADLKVITRITDNNGKCYGEFQAAPVAVPGARSKPVKLTGTVAGIIPWSPATPSLYYAEVTLRRHGTEVDRLTERFGFRKLEIRNNRLHLNGEELFVKGVTLHNGYGFYPSDSNHYEVAEVQANKLHDTRCYYPSDPSCEPELTPHREALLRDARLIKELGCNYVRLGHFPRIAPELDVFDEVGLLCSVENNLHWWQNDCACKFWARYKITDRHLESIRRHTTRQMARMIRRDMNHPSVTCWVVSSECRPGKKGVVEVIKAALNLARRLDPSRFATHASAEWHSELGQDDFSCDDVISINTYNKDINFWARELALLRRRYPDKPILCTEFPHFVSTRDPSLMTILQEMGGFLAGFCLYVFTGVGPSQSYRRRGQPKGYISRATYGLFDRRRKPVLFCPPEAKPCHFELDDRYALLPSAVLQKCRTRDEIYRKEIAAYRVLPVSDKIASPLVAPGEIERIDAAAHFGLKRDHLEKR